MLTIPGNMVLILSPTRFQYPSLPAIQDPLSEPHKQWCAGGGGATTRERQLLNVLSFCEPPDFLVASAWPLLDIFVPEKATGQQTQSPLSPKSWLLNIY